VIVEGLTGDIDGIVMKVLDPRVKPLTIDGLEDQGVADRVCPFVHPSALEDKDVPLGLAEIWNKTNN